MCAWLLSLKASGINKHLLRYILLESFIPDSIPEFGRKSSFEGQRHDFLLAIIL